MEAPNEEKRWDAPLFTISDPATKVLPFLEALSATLLKGKVAPVNISVVPARMEASNYLFELDRITQAIVRRIVDAQSEDGGAGSMVGDSIVVPGSSTPVVLARRIHLPELRRVQNQYLKMARLRTPDNLEGIANTFVDHVNMCIRTQGAA